MRFALTALTRTGSTHTLAWSDEDEHDYILRGSPDLIARAERLVVLGRAVGGRFVAGLTTPHQAYFTLVAVLREHGDVAGPIDFAGTDDDGEPLHFMPLPEADHLRTR